VYVQQYLCKVKQAVQFIIYNVQLFTKRIRPTSRVHTTTICLC